MKRSFVGIDLGGTRIKVALVSDGVVEQKKIIAAKPARGLAANLSFIQQEINVMLADAGMDQNSLLGIGMGFPGIVDPGSKKILSTNQKYDDAPGIDLEAWFRSHWSVPFFIDNDARMAAIGEWKYGAGAGSDNLVVMTIGTGIGAAAIVEGKLLRGKHFQAGCLGGHFSVNYNGRVCTCGNIGCAEAYASTWSVRERVMASPAYGNSLLHTVPAIDFESIFEMARKQDALAMEIIEDCLQVWAAAIVNMIHAYDPEIVVLGGGALNNHEEILLKIRELVHRHAWTPWGKVDIQPSKLLSNAGLLGVVHCLQNEI